MFIINRMGLLCLRICLAQISAGEVLGRSATMSLCPVRSVAVCWDPWYQVTTDPSEKSTDHLNQDGFSKKSAKKRNFARPWGFVLGAFTHLCNFFNNRQRMKRYEKYQSNNSMSTNDLDWQRVLFLARSGQVNATAANPLLVPPQILCHRNITTWETPSLISGDMFFYIVTDNHLERNFFPLFFSYLERSKISSLRT